MGLFSAGLGFLGARSANKAQERMHAQDTYNNSPQGIRANAEAAGFNPLVFAGPGVGTGAGYTPSLQNPLALLGEGIDAHFSEKEALKIQRSELDLENRRLEELVKRTTLSPNVPGIYGDRDARGSASASGVLSRSGVDGNSTSSVKDDIPSILVPWRTESGEIVMLPNPELPDADQYIPAIAGGTGGTLQSWFGWGPSIPSAREITAPLLGDPRPKRPKSRPKPKPEKPARTDLKEFMRQAYPTAFD